MTEQNPGRTISHTKEMNFLNYVVVTANTALSYSSKLSYSHPD